jgi:hypothetical protein
VVSDSKPVIARLDYALTSDLLVRVDVDPESGSISNESGTGDLFVRLGWRAMKQPKFALFVGADFSLGPPLIANNRIEAILATRDFSVKIVFTKPHSGRSELSFK